MALPPQPSCSTLHVSSQRPWEWPGPVIELAPPVSGGGVAVTADPYEGRGFQRVLFLPMPAQCAQGESRGQTEWRRLRLQGLQYLSGSCNFHAPVACSGSLSMSAVRCVANASDMISIAGLYTSSGNHWRGAQSSFAVRTALPSMRHGTTETQPPGSSIKREA